MQMTESEILRSYRQAEGPREQKRQIRVLAELNDVPVGEMTAIIAELQQADGTGKYPEHVTHFSDGHVVIPKGPLFQPPFDDKNSNEIKKNQDVKKPRAGKKRQAHRLVMEAVCLRLEEVESNINALKSEIEELTEKHKKYIKEWGVLKEWCTENE